MNKHKAAETSNLSSRVTPDLLKSKGSAIPPGLNAHPSVSNQLDSMSKTETINRSRSLDSLNIIKSHYDQGTLNSRKDQKSIQNLEASSQKGKVVQTKVVFVMELNDANTHSIPNVEPEGLEINKKIKTVKFNTLTEGIFIDNGLDGWINDPSWFTETRRSRPVFFLPIIGKLRKICCYFWVKNYEMEECRNIQYYYIGSDVVMHLPLEKHIKEPITSFISENNDWFKSLLSPPTEKSEDSK